MPRDDTAIPDTLADRLFWSGRMISVAGTSFTAIALPLAMVLVLGYGPAELSVVAAAGFIPAVLAPLWVPTVCAHFPARMLLVTADLVRAGAIFVVVALVTGARPSGFLLAAPNFIVGLGNSLFTVTLFANLEDIVGRDNLLRANGRLRAFMTSGEALGCAGAGFLVQIFGVAPVLLIDVASYLFSSVTLLKIRLPESASQVGSRRFLESLTRGFVVLRTHRVARLLILTSGFFNLLVGGSIAVLVVFLVHNLGFSPWQFALVMGIGSGGGCVTELVLGRLGRVASPRVALIAGLFCYALGQACYLMLNDDSVGSVVAAAAFDALIGAGISLYSTNNTTIQQLTLPADERTAVGAVARALTGALLPLGTTLGGAMAALWGERPVLVGVAAGQLVISLIVLARSTSLPAAFVAS